MKRIFFKSALTLAVTAASSQLLASGFAVNEQSISGMGTGFAGRSSAAEDASTVYGNPAGMARLKREQVSIGAAYLDAKTDIKNGHGANALGTDNGGSNKGDMVPGIAVPMGYYVKPLNDSWAVGLGLYAPFGLVTNYENNFAGRFFGDKSVVKVVTLQPTVSYAFNDKVSIGFGPTFNRISGELTSAAISVTPDTNVKVKGDDTAVGYNVGLLVQATDNTRFGLTYHSMVNYGLDGHTTVTGQTATALGLAGRFDASLAIKTPESTDFSITQKLNNDLTLYLGSTYTRWSRLKEITVKNSVPASAASFGTITEEQNWHDTWSHAIGLAYQLNPQWVLRTGLSVDQSPTNNTDRSPRIPTGDRKAVSFGAGFSPTPDITIDAALSYLKEESIKVNDNGGADLAGSYSGKYENSAFGFGTAVTYRF